MNSLVAHRVIIGVLVIGLVVAIVKIGHDKAGKDGNPSGFDVTMKNQIAVLQEGSLNSVPCLKEGSPCKVQVELHYLTIPAPTCPPQTGSSASGCPTEVPPPAGTVRVLRTCNATAGELCFSVNTKSTNDVANGNPFNVEIQDDDGWKPFDVNGQFILVFNPYNGKPVKKPPTR